MSGWSWKVADAAQNAKLNLRYEPGCWGDLLKGAWAIALGEALVRRAGGGHPAQPGHPGPALRVLDPFAGAPTYPLVDGTRRRLDALRPSDDPLVRALLARTDQEQARGVFVSAARFVQGAILGAGAACDLAVFDLDPGRRAAWQEQPDARVLPITSGEQALSLPSDVVFFDPYDPDAAWPALRDRLSTQREAPVLIYLFNHAPKGRTAFDDYRAFRRALDQALGDDRALVVGRVPSDAILPRAWHEVLLGGPRDLVGPLSAPLRATTLAMARLLADEGAFESRGV